MNVDRFSETDSVGSTNHACSTPAFPNPWGSDPWRPQSKVCNQVCNRRSTPILELNRNSDDRRGPVLSHRVRDLISGGPLLYRIWHQLAGKADQCSPRGGLTNPVGGPGVSEWGIFLAFKNGRRPFSVGLGFYETLNPRRNQHNSDAIVTRKRRTPWIPAVAYGQPPPTMDRIFLPKLILDRARTRPHWPPRVAKRRPKKPGNRVAYLTLARAGRRSSATETTEFADAIEAERSKNTSDHELRHPHRRAYDQSKTAIAELVRVRSNAAVVGRHAHRFSKSGGIAKPFPTVRFIKPG